MLSINSTRRDFLRQTCAATAGVGWLATPDLGLLAADDKAPATAPDLPIIDTHEHLWDLGKLRLPWLESAGELNRSFLPKDYAEAAAGLSVVKAVYMEVDAAAESKQAEAEYVLEICRRGDTPMVAAVIGGYPAADDFRRYITQFKDSRHIKGVRQIQSKAGPLADAKFRRGIQFLGELGMTFDLCQPPALLADAARLVDACPGTRFILDHCGSADVKWFLPPGKDEPAGQVAARREQSDRWRRDIAAVARRKNVVCKISGIVASAPKGRWSAEQLAPIVNHCLDEFGPERVMFAGDWPVCTRAATLGQWVKALKQIVANRPGDQQRKLFHDNAVRFYGLG